MKTKQSFLRKNRLGIGVLVGILSVLLIYWVSIAVYSALAIEGSCDKEIEQKLGKDSYTLIDATADEKARWPKVLSNGKIYKLRHEALECEHQKAEKLKTFIFF